MNTFNTIKRYCLVLLGIAIISSSCQSDGDNIIPDPGVLQATVDRTSIEAGESITFKDNSTKVYARSWTFQGGDPASSNAEEVTVTYATGGVFTAILEVIFIDNQTETKEFVIEVEGEPEPDFSTLPIFTEDPNMEGAIAVSFQNNNQFPSAIIEEDPYEGVQALSFTSAQTSDWAMGAIVPASGTVDFSGFAEGYYKFAIKSTSEGRINIRLQSSGQQAIVQLNPEQETYGYKNDGQWHLISIPLADFVAANNNLNLSAITHLMVLRSEGDVRTYNNYDFFIDHFHLSEVE